jgi:tRNA (mo5U34)-methyltransferase
MMFSPEDLLKLSKKIRWFHSIRFPDGSKSNGYVDPDVHFTLFQKHLPDINGKTILDIGAWDGYYSFKAEELGAIRVLATDHFCWNGPGWGTKDGFDLARKILNSSVESLEIDVPYIRPETVGRWDVVFFLGVLYHRTDFYESFRRAASVTDELLVVDTVVDLEVDQSIPLIRFYPDSGLAADPTNWFVPNKLAVLEMFFAEGFRLVESVDYTSGRPLHPRSIFYGYKP